MICTRYNNPEIRYNYKFIPETDKVEVSNKDFHDVISYDEWCKEYYIIDKWRTIKDDI